MDIGRFYQIQVPKPEREPEIYYEMMDQVPFAEEMGLSSVWMADHQFRSEWSHSSAPDATLAALSQRTSHIRLGVFTHSLSRLKTVSSRKLESSSWAIWVVSGPGINSLMLIRPGNKRRPNSHFSKELLGYQGQVWVDLVVASSP